jgi:glycosyltransferase involved in cell wall biosynthesis
MFYDLIIVTQSLKELIPITQQCIDTARADTKDINVIVVETGQPYLYEGMDKQVIYNGVFNYNRALNLGLKYVKGDVHILANNDIIFHEGWSKIGDLMKAHNYHSASAKAWHLTMFEDGDHIYEGYNVGYVLTGWCIFVDRFCIEQIGALDEGVSFWYSDNLYAHQIEEKGIVHAMFCNVKIDHLCSKTLTRQSSRVQRQYQTGELYKYETRRRYYAARKKLNKIHT